MNPLEPIDSQSNTHLKIEPSCGFQTDDLRRFTDRRELAVVGQH